MQEMATKNKAQKQYAGILVWGDKILSWVAVLFLLFFGFVITFIPRQPQIATVNINKIISEFVKTTAAKNLAQEKAKEEVKEFGTKLEKELHSIAKAKGLILIPNEAVIVSAKDFTREVQNKLSY